MTRQAESASRQFAALLDDKPLGGQKKEKKE
eukprot:CAMPEP_0202711660 /NCGR_PEP_ID=MMETSP1385-20130828/23905_1 /ASSEMBLY_ACC=CAM_ASM_000861 /TAXON_ID=933848 /ORGANISM="Elphidium margaritaceum" /LENGTH=30 /DNA_ID= /DNA_START= /DNA_END= /DNA_ORIENTATION=